jgi:hypothetical protein
LLYWLQEQLQREACRQNTVNSGTAQGDAKRGEEADLIFVETNYLETAKE